MGQGQKLLYTTNLLLVVNICTKYDVMERTQFRPKDGQSETSIPHLNFIDREV